MSPHNVALVHFLSTAHLGCLGFITPPPPLLVSFSLNCGLYK